jgi:hypothetical protein
VKRYRLVFALALVFVLAFLSCKKINEATELGGDLVPAVDNINTFEAVLNTVTDNKIFGDTTKNYYSDNVALGKINDPVFGKTSADVYFNISSPSYGVNPFDSLIGIDSVVLSLAYNNTYGDTNSQHSVSVYEIAQNSSFVDTSVYYFNGARQSAFTVTGSALGSKTFTTARLKDSIQVIRPGDTTKVANVIRIPLANSLATRFSSFDTAATINGGFHSDSIFKTLFRGFKVQSESSTGNGGLVYLSLSDQKTRLTVYYRKTKNGLRDTTSYSFYHSTNGQANLITRTPEGNYATTLSNSTPNDAELYIQSAPGSYSSVVIPGLDTLKNKVVHRAELVAYRIIPPGDLSNIFTPPTQLFLDRTHKDTAILLEKDLPVNSTGTLSFQNFGGTLKLDNTYRFNITRYVQDIITSHTPNDTLRLYAPLRTNQYVPASGKYLYNIPVLSQVAYGRVVLAGGNYTDPNMRLRLRVIYSNL